jgi:DnaK suppressor protein
MNMTETTTRNADLRHMLSTRRREVQDDVQNHIRHGRNGRSSEGGDELEQSDANIQGDLDCALLQMRVETLTRIDEALARIDGGQYGTCRGCGCEIAERRLRALPFAVRCQVCEERREEQGDGQRIARRRSRFSLFPDIASS